MKKAIILIFVLFATGFAFSQNVTKVDFYQEGKTVVVTYHLDKASAIDLHVSTDGGKTYSVPLQKVSGNVGKNVPAGDNRIVWNALEEYEKLVGENIVFKVVAGKFINGHEYVDLGLPSGLKWATCNVGADKPEDYGDYFAWGETTTKSSYTEENSKTWEKSMGSIAGNAQYDAARANWGGSWRLPTMVEFDELCKKCTWTWTTQGGHRGYKVTGPNGNSIFLPAAGYRYGTSLSYDGENGYYWYATPYESNTQSAYYLSFRSGYHSTDWSRRYYGQSVRPVAE